jgi:hypothetical protein
MSEACTGQLDGKYGSTAFCWYVDFGVRTTDACVTVHPQSAIADSSPGLEIPTVRLLSGT